jgi:hypothetical protein
MQVYHTDAPASNLTPVVDPAIFITPRLRVTFRIVESLTRNNLRCCFAALSRIATYRKKSTVTVRRHIAELCDLGILRKRSISGSIDHLFICPVSEWKVVPECPQNDLTYPSIADEAIAKKNKQPTRRTASKPRPQAAPVVVLSATPSEETDQDEEEDLSAFRAYLESEEEGGEDANAALGDVETLVPPTDTAPASLAPVNAPSASPVPEPAPVLASPVNSPARAEVTPADSAPTVKASPKPSPSPLTPEARRTLEQLVAAGVSHTMAAQSVQDDPARADAALRAFVAYQQRKPVDCPTALYRVAFREGWKPRERQENCNGFNSRPVTAAALGLVASPPSGNGATVTVQDAAALRAMIASTRRAVNPLRC